MDELYSCRNCINNCGQSLTIGRGVGFCLQHDSVIPNPERTTCKYLHRKDLPQFVVEEGIREHAAEFAGFSRLVTLDTHEPIERIQYSERYQWEHRSFDSITHTVAQYHKVKPRWILLSAFAGGVDGRRSLTHSAMLRHYMDHCNTWASSYRLVLGILQEFAVRPEFSPDELLLPDGSSPEMLSDEALWDVVFVRLSALQEYGWHAGLESLMWASDAVNGGLSELSWPLLSEEFAKLRGPWVNLIIEHAKEHGEYFRVQDQSPTEEEDEF